MSDEKPDIRITGGNPTPEELAAVTAVLAAALDELAGAYRRRSADGPTGWDRSRRALRRPLPFGSWRDFSA